MVNSKFNKLTKEQRKALWAPSDENAGAGWQTTGSYDRPRSRYPRRERDTTKSVDEELV
jgi:hypothetical protein